MPSEQHSRAPNNGPNPSGQQNGANQNGQAQSDTPEASASIAEFMRPSTDDKDREVHDAISGSDEREEQRNGSK